LPLAPASRKEVVAPGDNSSGEAREEAPARWERGRCLVRVHLAAARLTLAARKAAQPFCADGGDAERDGGQAPGGSPGRGMR